MSALPPDETDGPFDGEDLTAAEYALGVLDREARQAAEARSAQDPAFAEDIIAWVKRFEPLIDGVPSVEPSPTVWPRVETAIDRPKTRSGPTSPPVPANDIPTRRRGGWIGWTAGIGAVAAAAIAFVAIRDPSLIGISGPASIHMPAIPALATSSPTMVATLSLTESKASAMTVAYDPAQSTLYAAPDTGFSIPIAKSAELWLIPADGKPRRMGLVDPAKPATMPMPPQFKALAKAQATLAISIEPTGGSPTGLPTGPVVATGKFVVV